MERQEYITKLRNCTSLSDFLSIEKHYKGEIPEEAREIRLRYLVELNSKKIDRIQSEITEQRHHSKEHTLERVWGWIWLNIVALSLSITFIFVDVKLVWLIVSFIFFIITTIGVMVTVLRSTFKEKWQALHITHKKIYVDSKKFITSFLLHMQIEKYLELSGLGDEAHKKVHDEKICWDICNRMYHDGILQDFFFVNTDVLEITRTIAEYIVDNWILIYKEYYH